MKSLKELLLKEQVGKYENLTVKELKARLSSSNRKKLEDLLRLAISEEIEWHPRTVGPMNWDKAVTYAESLGSGWRLPTKEELKKAYTAKVPGFKLSYYWSEEYQLGTGFAWVVLFGSGVVDSFNKVNDFYVRCVRSV